MDIDELFFYQVVIQRTTLPKFGRYVYLVIVGAALVRYRQTEANSCRVLLYVGAVGYNIAVVIIKTQAVINHGPLA